MTDQELRRMALRLRLILNHDAGDSVGGALFVHRTGMLDAVQPLTAIAWRFADHAQTADSLPRPPVLQRLVSHISRQCEPF